HIELVLSLTNLLKNLDHTIPLFDTKTFNVHCSTLWCEDAHPNSLDGWIGRPEIHKLRNVPSTRYHCASDGTVNCNMMALNVMENSVVSRGLAACVVFGLQSIN